MYQLFTVLFIDEIYVYVLLRTIRQTVNLYSKNVLYIKKACKYFKDEYIYCTVHTSKTEYYLQEWFVYLATTVPRAYEWI